MYWGRTLDECTSQFCFTTFGLASPFGNVDKRNKEKLYIKPLTSHQNEKPCQADQEILNEKRSLKKSQTNLKSPTCSSINTTSNVFCQTKTLNNLNLSKKTSITKMSQKEQIFWRTKNEPSTYENTLRHDFVNSQYLNYQANFLQNSNTKQNKIKDGYIFKFSNQTNMQESSGTQRFFHKEGSYQNSIPGYSHLYSCDPKSIHGTNNSQGFSNANLTRCIYPNGRIFENMRILPPTQQRIVYQNPIPNSIHPNIKITQTSNFRNPESQQYTPVQSIQNLAIDSSQRFPNGQFTTIREENQTYEQSKSMNEPSKDLYPITFYELQEKTLRVSVLNEINNSEEQRHQKNQETFYEVIQNNQPEFLPGSQESSRISGENKVSNFDLSCEELMIQSQTTEKVDKNSENMKFLDLIRKKQQEQMQFTKRRQMHQPSICLKMIENKIRGVSYQMSRTSSEGIQSIYKSSNPAENPVQSIHSPRNISSPRQGSQQSIFKSPNKKKMHKQKVSFNLENQPKFIEEKVSLSNQKSLIHLLEDQKENENLRLATFSRQHQGHGHNLVQENLFKQSINQNEIHSEKQVPTSVRKLFLESNKKVKSLIQQKATMNSILEESSSIGRNLSNQRSNSNQMNTNFILDDNNLEGILSNNNVERDESTVIGRYTFENNLQKLL